jgi:hypothetical protein
MVLCWLLPSGNCRWPKNISNERQQVAHSNNANSVERRPSGNHITNLMKRMKTLSRGQVKVSGSSLPLPGATFLSRILSVILVHSILFLASGFSTDSSRKQIPCTAVVVVFTFPPGLGHQVQPSGGQASPAQTHHSMPTDPDHITMHLLRSLLLSRLPDLPLRSHLTRCAPPKQLVSSQATTQAGILFPRLSQQFLTQHALSLRRLWATRQPSHTTQLHCGPLSKLCKPIPRSSSSLH